MHKLAAKYFGPYKVIRKIGEVAYEVELPEGTRVHPVFHVSLLKKYVGSSSMVSSTLPPTDNAGQFMLEPEEILGRKMVKRHNVPVTQILVRWKFAQPEDATWEDLEIIQQQFPEFLTTTPPTSSILVDKDPF